MTDVHDDDNAQADPKTDAPRARQRWNTAERFELTRMVCGGVAWSSIAKSLGRSSRSVKLEFALCVERGLVKCVQNFTNEDSAQASSDGGPPPSGPPPSQRGDHRHGDIFDVINRRDGSIWYSFSRRNGKN